MSQEETFKKIVGDPKKSFLVKDADGDGVVNMLDCKPYDKNKQGWVHNLAAKAAEKVGATGTAERIRERGEESDFSSDERAARKEDIQRDANVERYKQEKQSAIYREEQKAESQRRDIKQQYAAKPKGQQGSGFKGLGGLINTISSSTKPSMSAGRKKADKNRDGIPDIFGSKTDKNRDGIPDIMGIHKKRGKGGIPKIF